MKNIVELGNITLSDKAVVSDPCYSRGTWCMEENVPVLPGKYKAYAVSSDEKKYGIRIASLICINTDFFSELKSAMMKKWVEVGEIGVDSGQAGIFDHSVYPLEHEAIGEYGQTETFYGECCEATLGEKQCGRLKSENGIVSSSGYGDGMYTLKAIQDNEINIALMIDFNIISKRKIMEIITMPVNVLDKH